MVADGDAEEKPVVVVAFVELRAIELLRLDNVLARVEEDDIFVRVDAGDVLAVDMPDETEGDLVDDAFIEIVEILAEVEEEGFINRLVDPDLEIMEEDAGPELPATDLSEVLADEDTDFEEELVLTVVDSPVDVDFGVVDEPRSMGEEVLLGLAATDLSEVLTDFADELGLTVVNIPVVDFEELDELLITVDEELVVLPAEDLSVVEDEPDFEDELGFVEVEADFVTEVYGTEVDDDPFGTPDELVVESLDGGVGLDGREETNELDFGDGMAVLIEENIAFEVGVVFELDVAFEREVDGTFEIEVDVALEREVDVAFDCEVDIAFERELVADFKVEAIDKEVVFEERPVEDPLTTVDELDDTATTDVIDSDSNSTIRFQAPPSDTRERV